jgi:arylsulfatase A-like enzyme
MQLAGGVHVPAFIGGGFVEAELLEHSTGGGQHFTGLVHVTDIHATILALAGEPLDGELDGVNQWPALKSKDGLQVRNEVKLATYLQFCGGTNDDFTGGS